MKIIRPILILLILFSYHHAIALEYPEAKECRNGDAFSCLKIALIENGHESDRHLMKGLKIHFKNFNPKSPKAEDMDIALVSEVLLLKRPEDISNLPKACGVHKFYIACYVMDLFEIARNNNPKKVNVEKSLYNEKCNQGDGFACHLTSIIFGILENENQFISYLKKGCGLDYFHACLTLGDDLFTKEKYSEALDYFSKPCEHNYPASCEKASMAKSKLEGAEKAKTFLIDKCTSGNGGACSYLAVALIDETNQSDKEKYLKKACDYGNDLGCLSLSEFYSKNNKNGDARQAVIGGCQHENPGACYQLGMVCLKIQDQDCSHNAFQTGCDNGSGESCLGIAMEFLKSKNPNMKKIKEYMRYAKDNLTADCSDGSNHACDQLSDLMTTSKKFNFDLDSK